MFSCFSSKQTSPAKVAPQETVVVPEIVTTPPARSIPQLQTSQMTPRPANDLLKDTARFFKTSMAVLSPKMFGEAKKNDSHHTITTSKIHEALDKKRKELGVHPITFER